MEKKHLEELAALIREQRSNESNFETLYKKLEEEASKGAGNGYKQSLIDVKEKAAEEYRKAKETGGTAWPEYENFVAGFEKAVIEALKQPT